MFNCWMLTLAEMIRSSVCICKKKAYGRRYDKHPGKDTDEVDAYRLKEGHELWRFPGLPQRYFRYPASYVYTRKESPEGEEIEPDRIKNNNKNNIHGDFFRSISNSNVRNNPDGYRSFRSPLSLSLSLHAA